MHPSTHFILRIVGHTGGGSSVHVYQINKGLQKAGVHSVTYLRPPLFADPLTTGALNGMDYRHDLNPIRILLFSILNRKRILYVHSHLRNATAIGWVISKVIGRPHVITIHAPLYEGQPGFRDRIFAGIIGRAMRASSQVIFISKFIRKHVLEQVNVSASEVKSNIVYNGTKRAVITEQKPIRTSDKLVICVAGELTPRKNIADVVWLARRLTERGFGSLVEFKVYGDGPLRGFLADAAETYTCLTWHGFAERYEEIFREADAHMILSKTEAFGRVITEAMSFGLPTLAYRTGAFPEIIDHGQTGLLFDDREALAAAIEDLAGDREQLARLSDSAQESFLQRFSEEIFVENSMEIFRRLLKA